MNGRVAKKLRREGRRRRKHLEDLRVDDATSYAFDPDFYKDRRNHTVTVKLEKAGGYEIIGYWMCKWDAPDLHNPTDFLIDKPAKVKKGYEVRAVIKKPLRGFPTPPREYERVIGDNGEKILIGSR